MSAHKLEFSGALDCPGMRHKRIIGKDQQQLSQHLSCTALTTLSYAFEELLSKSELFQMGQIFSTGEQR